MEEEVEKHLLLAREDAEQRSRQAEAELFAMIDGESASKSKDEEKAKKKKEKRRRQLEAKQTAAAVAVVVEAEPDPEPEPEPESVPQVETALEPELMPDPQPEPMQAKNKKKKRPQKSKKKTAAASPVGSSIAVSIVEPGQAAQAPSNRALAEVEAPVDSAAAAKLRAMLVGLQLPRHFEALWSNGVGCDACALADESDWQDLGIPLEDGRRIRSACGSPVHQLGDGDPEPEPKPEPQLPPMDEWSEDEVIQWIDSGLAALTDEETTAVRAESGRCMKKKRWTARSW